MSQGFTMKKFTPFKALSVALIAAGTSLMSGSLVSYAQDNASSNDIISQAGVSILNFDEKNLGPILTELKILWQGRTGPDGRPFIFANSEGETVFVLSPLACRGANNTDCVGLQLISVFDGVVIRKNVDDFNNRYAFANLGVNEQGNAYLNRYDIADYGIARGNVATIITTFASLSKIYQDSIKRSAVAGLEALEGEITTTNVITADAQSSFAPAGKSAFDLLRLVEASQVRKMVFEDQELPVNKVKNIGQ